MPLDLLHLLLYFREWGGDVRITLWDRFQERNVDFLTLPEDQLIEEGVQSLYLFVAQIHFRYVKQDLLMFSTVHLIYQRKRIAHTDYLDFVVYVLVTHILDRLYLALECLFWVFEDSRILRITSIRQRPQHLRCLYHHKFVSTHQ